MRNLEQAVLDVLPADWHGLAAAQAAVQHQQHPRPGVVIFRYLANDVLLLVRQRAALFFACDRHFEISAGRGHDQAVDLRLLEDRADDVAQLRGRSCAERLAVVRPRLVEQLLHLEGLHVRDRERAKRRSDAQPDVRFVIDALGRADARRFVGAKPLPRPLLDGRLAGRAAALCQRADLPHLRVKTHFAVVLDVLPDRLAVRAVADDDACFVFVVGHGNLS